MKRFINWISDNPQLVIPVGCVIMMIVLAIIYVYFPKTAEIINKILDTKII